MTAFPIIPAATTAALLALTAPTARAAEVVTTDPVRYQLGVSPDLQLIRITLDQAVPPPASSMVRVAGTMSGLHSGNLGVDGTAIVFENTSEPFMPGELVHVNVRNDVVNRGYYFAFTIASAPSSPTWSTRRSFGTSARPYFIHGGDLDNDGMPDIAAPNEDTNDVSIFLNSGGTGQFPAHSEYPVGIKPSSVFGEDLDNDGYQDLATADINSGTMTVLLNDGDASFTVSGTYPAGTLTRQIHGGDFDGDNDIDLCTTSTGTDEIYLFFNNGDGTFAPGVPSASVGSGPFAIRTGDFDGNGHLDIGVANQTSGTLSVLLNNGLAFLSGGTYTIGSGPWCLNGNDFDGDGDFDLISVASFANRIVLLLNQGNGAFPTRVERGTGPFPLGVFAADLDGDGDVDATSSNFAGRSVNIFLNDGSGGLTLDRTLDLPQAGTYTWAHDLDGDGDLDISTLDELADSLFIYPNESPPVITEDPEPSAMGLPPGPRLRVAPNPVGPGATVRLRLDQLPDGIGPVVVEIVGVDGRHVRRLLAEAAAGGELNVVWDTLDDAGRAVPAGQYVVVAAVGQRRLGHCVRVVR